MNHLICTDCHNPIPAGLAVIRSVSFERVTYCRPCAADLGLFVPATRAPLSNAIDAKAAQLVAEVEAYVGGRMSA